MKLKHNNGRDTILPTHINSFALHGGQHSYITKKPGFLSQSFPFAEKHIHIKNDKRCDSTILCFMH